ncbi:two component transcriptional regulator, LuxR family [Indibacter alkaliphilus LW1]|uniref:Two component transcriptional regulator, LuxR family n=2 Tax=Indibacter TaxID=647744 RepID=S2E2I0_INDAL|nr:two component transcriptional regulator, LuxR family [Indibacter alkaliphilus LW1]
MIFTLTTMKNLKIAIVDDHELFLYGISYILEKNLGRNNFLKFSEAREVLKYLRNGMVIDFLIADIEMPDLDGIKLLSIIKREFAETKVLILSADADLNTVQLCKNLGADGYVTKDCYRSQLIDAMTEIMEGSTYFFEVDPGKVGVGSKNIYQHLEAEYGLTQREIEVLQLILNEYVTPEIAEKLGCSAFTIKTHRRNLFKKLGIRNLTGLIHFIGNLEFREIEK